MKGICPSQMIKDRFWQPLADGFTALKIFLEVPEVEQSEFFKIFHRMCLPGSGRGSTQRDFKTIYDYDQLERSELLLDTWLSPGKGCSLVAGRTSGLNLGFDKEKLSFRGVGGKAPYVLEEHTKEAPPLWTYRLSGNLPLKIPYKA
jgi:hypothetical protein